MTLDELCGALRGRGWLQDHDDSAGGLHNSSWVLPASECPDLDSLNPLEPHQLFTRVCLAEDPMWCDDPNHEVWVSLSGAHPADSGEGWHLTCSQLVECLATIEQHHPLDPNPFPQWLIAQLGCQHQPPSVLQSSVAAV